MRTRLAIGIVILQLAVLAFMAGQREWVVRTGRTILLRTAPVDPRDPMRGDYVRFNYEIANVPRAQCRGEMETWFSADWKQREAVRDRRVFAELQLNDEGVAELVALSDREPSAGLYLRGRVGWIDDRRVQVRYGVEALFMEQGKGLELERSPKLAAGVPLNIEVAVSGSGLAVAKGYRWEPLGLAVQLEWGEVRNGVTGSPARVLEAIVAEVKNHGDVPVAIVARPEGASFRLLADERWNPARFRWVGEKDPVPPATPEAVKVLQPGEAYRERLDLRRPKWFLLDASGAGAAEPVTWVQVAGMWNAQFRLEYVPPAKAERAELPHAELIRMNVLRSRAFNAGGGVD